MQKEANGATNGKPSILQTLASSSDRWVQLGTLALVGVSGLGNFIQGERLSSAQVEDREKAVRQINQMYQRIDDFERRQAQSISAQRDLLETNSQQLKNQTEILSNEQNVLRILREGQNQYLRQQRQTPQPPDL